MNRICVGLNGLVVDEESPAKLAVMMRMDVVLMKAVGGWENLDAFLTYFPPMFVCHVPCEVMVTSQVCMAVCTEVVVGSMLPMLPAGMRTAEVTNALETAPVRTVFEMLFIQEVKRKVTVTVITSPARRIIQVSFHIREVVRIVHIEGVVEVGSARAHLIIDLL